MSDSERVKGLLDGSMDPTELEGDDELYALAERIYGREALEEMGVSTPERPAENVPQLSQNGIDMDIELPEIDDSVEGTDRGPQVPRRRKLAFLVGLIGVSLVGMNISIGIGQYFDLCVDDLEPDPLGFTVTANEQNGSLYITWTVTNLNLSANYSIQWSISQNGSSELVDRGYFNWTTNMQQSAMAHTEHRAGTTPPWCYITSLHEEGVKISDDTSSNGCVGNSSSASSLATISPVPSLCEDNTRLLWNEASNYESIDSWAASGSGDLLDGALLMLFGILTLFGLFSKKQ
jgi:hypothetical protein